MNNGHELHRYPTPEEMNAIYMAVRRERARAMVRLLFLRSSERALESLAVRVSEASGSKVSLA